MAKKKPSSPVKTITLDQNFWSNFAKKYWEQKPLVLKKVKSALLEIDDSQIFNLLVLYSDRCRKLKNAEGFKFYISGLKASDGDILQILPVRKDKTLLGYHARMTMMFSDYCLVCDELLKSSADQQNILTDFTNKLYRQVGFPNRFSEMGLYLGNYRKTPFGVHIDHCGVFSFPVVGQKKFRLWTSDFVRKNPKLDRTFNYEKYKKNSEVLIAQPGDLAYWPSSAWHIAESDGTFSVTWSLGVWVDQPHQKTFSDTLGALLGQKMGVIGNTTTTVFKNLHEPSGQVKQLPKAYIESIKLLQSLSSTQLHDAFLKSWMLHISSQGFKNIAQSDLKLEFKTQIRLRSQLAKVLWQESLTEKNKIYFCFGGVLIESKKTGDLFRLMNNINAGQICLISDYLKGATKNQNLKLLQLLAVAFV